MTLPEQRRMVRKGAVLLMAVVCLAVASIIFMAILRSSVAARQSVDTEAWHQQAVWLAHSGLERAAARLAVNPDYLGETWTVPAGQISASDGALVVIEVETPGDDPARRSISVRADYPNHPRHRARYTKQAVIETNPLRRR